MDPALYAARLIHSDLTFTNAKAWQWWIAVSPYDYKDGLIHIDYNTEDGEIYESKLLWAMGNYARFVRPGMQRVEITRDDNQSTLNTLTGVMVSSYMDPTNLKVVTVAINYGTSSEPFSIDAGEDAEFDIFETSAAHNLGNVGRAQRISSTATAHALPPRSITTFVQV